MSPLHRSVMPVGWSIIALAAACEPTVTVGTWDCAQAHWSGDAGQTDAAVFPWRTEFEHGFCDYPPPDGFCYTSGKASYRIVTSPVRSRDYAAAFTVSAEPDNTGQARCVRNGAFPASAYYGAWYYFPEASTSTGNWNLFHFQGGAGPADLHGLWDVSLVNDPAGRLRLAVFDFLGTAATDTMGAPVIPIGAWVHIQVHWKRAADETGEFTLYQDGVVILRLQNLVTDDSVWGQWYLGNLAEAIEPPESTVYVDDVAISETP